MLSAFSKLADKAFIIGFYLPALVAAVCFLPTLPIDKETFPVKEITKINSLTDLTFFALGVWLLAVILVTLNYWMYRALEGYFGPLKSKHLTAKHVAKSNALWEEIDSAYVRLQRLKAKKPASEALRREILKARDDFFVLNWSSRSRYPTDEHRVLPTRFGNSIVAFETYPTTVYGVEPITLWPRLQSVMPKEYVANLIDSRSVVDFFVNTVYLATGFALWSLYRFIADRIKSGHWDLGVLLAVVTALVASMVAYRFAVSAAEKWGDVVKSAFDLYLPALAHQLGYELPACEAKRREFWMAFAQQFQFREPVKPEMWTVWPAPQEKSGSSESEDVPEEEKQDDDEPRQDKYAEPVGRAALLVQKGRDAVR